MRPWTRPWIPFSSSRPSAEGLIDGWDEEKMTGIKAWPGPEGLDAYFSFLFFLIFFFDFWKMKQEKDEKKN